MLQFSRHIEYSFMALKHLAESGRGTILSAREISEKLKIPYDNVAKALQKFTKMSLVESVHGVTGGYRLSGDLSKISMLEIMQVLHGPVGIVRCQTDGEACELIDSCNILGPLKKLNHQFAEMLNNQSVQDFLGLNIQTTALPSETPAMKSDYAVW